MNKSKFFLAMFLLATPAPLSADVFTVGPDGAYSSIYQGIEEASNAAGSGHQVRIQQGLFMQNVFIVLSADGLVVSGGWDQSFTHREDDPTLTVIDGGGVGAVFEIYVVSGSLTLRNLTLTNGTGESGGGLALTTENSAEITVQNCRIVGNTVTVAPDKTWPADGGGVYARLQHSSRLHFFDNVVSENAAQSSNRVVGGGIHVYASQDSWFELRRNTVESNRLQSDSSSCEGAGLSIGVSGNSIGFVTDNRVAANECAGTGWQHGYGGRLTAVGSSKLVATRNTWLANQGLADYSSGHISLYSAQNAILLFSDSVVAEGSRDGVRASTSESATLRITGLTVTDHPELGIGFQGTGSSSLANTIVFNNQPETSLTDVVQSANLIGVDPFFVDPGSSDYRLLPGSPAVDRGDNSPPGGLTDRDCEGSPRVVGQAVDVGAFELQSGEEVFYFPVFADGQQSGLGYKSAILATNLGGEDIAVTMDFFDREGRPAAFQLGPAAPERTSVSMRLRPGESFSGETPGMQSIRAGYARVRAGAGVGAAAYYTGFDARDGALLFRAGVPSSPTVANCTVFVDSMGRLDTGLAIVNPVGDEGLQAADANLTLRLYDQNFQLLDEALVSLPDGQSASQFIHQLFPSVEVSDEIQGIVTLQSDRPVAVLTLFQEFQAGGDFPKGTTLTTVPVLPGRSDASP